MQLSGGNVGEGTSLSIGDNDLKLRANSEHTNLDSISLDTVYDASVELAMLQNSPSYQKPFILKSFSTECDVELEDPSDSKKEGLEAISKVSMEAKVKVIIGDRSFHEVTEGNGPVNAFDKAFKKALLFVYPEIENARLCSYKVDIDDPDSATAAITAVEIQAEFAGKKWFSVGRSTDIIKASALALRDLYELYLHKSRVETPPTYEI